ncbi:hypothetical protein V6U71_02065 [Sphingopyxis sp. J-6]|uniref:hypothetical protein n=1 Tax=Sphingopyxis sp. J-6 TaxID=3122054 RepID=UPI0010F813EC
MSFFVYHRYGASQRDPSPSIFSELLDELEERLDDTEHVAVSVVHESEWGLSISHGGYVAFENVESDDEPRHMKGLSREKLISLMENLAAGNLDELENERWQSGY